MPKLIAVDYENTSADGRRIPHSRYVESWDVVEEIVAKIHALVGYYLTNIVIMEDYIAP